MNTCQFVGDGITFALLSFIFYLTSIIRRRRDAHHKPESAQKKPNNAHE